MLPFALLLWHSEALEFTNVLLCGVVVLVVGKPYARHARMPGTGCTSKLSAAFRVLLERACGPSVPDRLDPGTPRPVLLGVAMLPGGSIPHVRFSFHTMLSGPLP